jgi:hypothetical protein
VLLTSNRSLDIRTHLAVVFKHHLRYHDLRSSKTSCVDGKQPSTRSVGMNLARSLEAGIEEAFFGRVLGGPVTPALRGRAKFNRRSATKTARLFRERQLADAPAGAGGKGDRAATGEA